MTLYQFNQLDEMEQQEAIWNKGVKLAVREDDEFKYTLYQIDKFYVERLFNKELGVTRDQRTFQSPNEYLDPYLDQINPKL
jgi:hypothetical protein